MERGDLMKKTLRIVILTEMKEYLSHDLNMLEDVTYITTDVKEKSILLKKINYTKDLINEVNEMIEEL